MKIENHYNMHIHFMGLRVNGGGAKQIHEGLWRAVEEHFGKQQGVDDKGKIRGWNSIIDGQTIHGN